MPTDDKDPKVKDLIEQSVARGEPLEALVDAVTAQSLERWFGAPSFAQTEQAAPALSRNEADMAEVRERRRIATEAVDPHLLASILSRFPEEGLLLFTPDIKQHVDPSIALFDLAMVENKLSISEPRDYTRPEDIEDELKDNTPQSMLRDLHRPELEFEKQFEQIDMAADQKIDIVAEVSSAMATSWKLPPLGEPPSHELRRQIAEARAERTSPWQDIPRRVNLPNRRVTE